MQASFDPHDELGIPGHASEREIKEAYRRLAAQWHPDRNPNPRAAERMARINQAYRQLNSGGAVKRPSAASASASPAAPSSGEAEPPPRASRGWWDRDWGKARWEPDGAVAPRTLRHEAGIRLEDAAFGCTQRIKGSIADLCATCHGVGRLVSRRSDCRTCHGEGRAKTAGGRWQRCASCAGDGADRQACADCEASGQARTARRYHFDVRIPAGIRDGQTVMLRGQGQRGPGSAGDIELAIHVEPHPVFAFDPQNRLSCVVPIDVFTAMTGSPIEIPTLEGDMLPIDPAGGPTQVLEGRGFPQRDGSRGPLVVQLQTVTPTRFNRAQLKLLRELADDLRGPGSGQNAELAAWQQRLNTWRAAAERARA